LFVQSNLFHFKHYFDSVITLAKIERIMIF